MENSHNTSIGSNLVLRYSLCRQEARKPMYATEGSMGFDIYATDGGNVPAHGQIVCPSGLILEIPKGYGGFLTGRSGLLIKYRLDVPLGKIDSDYRGEIGIVLENSGDEEYIFKKGDRIAQIVILPCPKFDLVCVESRELLSVTDRGSGGFGSTGGK